MKRNTEIAPVLKSLSVGQKAVYPVTRRSTLSTAATLLKEKYGLVFKINKQDDELIVTRVA